MVVYRLIFLKKPTNNPWAFVFLFIKKVYSMKEIKNESEYEMASDRADAIFNAKKGTEEYAELQVLLKALKQYEDDFVKMLKGN
jgi:hypothetical protein